MLLFARVPSDPLQSNLGSSLEHGGHHQETGSVAVRQNDLGQGTPSTKHDVGTSHGTKHYFVQRQVPRILQPRNPGKASVAERACHQQRSMHPSTMVADACRCDARVGVGVCRCRHLCQCQRRCRYSAAWDLFFSMGATVSTAEPVAPEQRQRPTALWRRQARNWTTRSAASPWMPTMMSMQSRR